MTHRFIVSDETIVNSHGYRVLTDGIDTRQYERNPVVLYMHNRGWGDPGAVVGRAVKLEKSNGKLIADVEFDEEDETAKKLSGKVKRGFIKMASLYADVMETSKEPEHILPGQQLATVSKCKMVELSIVDIGGNDNAIKLSRDGKPAVLEPIEEKTENQNSMDVKTIALALGMDADTKPELVQKEVAKIKLAKEKAEARVAELETTMKASQTAEAESLLTKAVSLGLIPEGLKASQMKAFESDFEGQKVVLSKLIEEKEDEAGKSGTHKAVKEVILNGKAGAGKGAVELSFDYLQKNDPQELRRIRDEEPETYVKLAKEYEAGKRWGVK